MGGRKFEGRERGGTGGMSASPRFLLLGFGSNIRLRLTRSVRLCIWGVSAAMCVTFATDLGASDVRWPSRKGTGVRQAPQEQIN